MMSLMPWSTLPFPSMLSRDFFMRIVILLNYLLQILLCTLVQSCVQWTLSQRPASWQSVSLGMTLGRSGNPWPSHVDLSFLLFCPEGALSTSPSSEVIPDVTSISTGNPSGTSFTSDGSNRGNPPAPEVLSGASKPLTPTQARRARCKKLAEACA